MMKSKLILTFLLLISICKASHIAGGQITWKTVSDSTYNFEVSLYHDCDGINMNTFINLNVDGTPYQCSFKSKEQLPLPCQQVLTTCNGGSYTGIEKYIYSKTITLTRGYHTFSWSACCRNASIIDIYNPDLAYFYIYSTLDNTVKDYDSPSFSDEPFAFVCAGQNVCFDIGNYLTIPKQSASTTVDYVYPYSYSYPVKLSGGVSGNIFCFTASTLGTGITASVIELYDNGNLVASVERDMQITVVNCPCGALPVTLLSFEGYATDSTNLLSWSTASEINADYFIIVRNGERIGIRGCAGSPHSYSFIDSKPERISRYHLMQYDMDGKYNSSESIAVLNRNLKSKSKYNLLGQECK